MPTRNIPFVTNEIYHIFNRSITLTPTFNSKRDYQRALELLNYYQFAHPPLSFSKFKKRSQKDRSFFFQKLKKEGKHLTRIICFCLMPNHFHLLLKQNQKEGISKMIANFQNSYTRFFNLKNKRVGPLFQGAFKAVRIETDEQLLHVSRYIHLNPYSSMIVKTLKQLKKYPWSSLEEYLQAKKEKLSMPEEILSFFKTLQEYQKYVFNQADYQKELEKIKHIMLE